ncbi:MAG: PA0069 family radical SAM protein [Pseudomonadota bacterium]
MAGARSFAPHGRGTGDNPGNRYRDRQRETVDDGWTPAEPPPALVTTKVRIDPSRSILSRNDSPDVPFEQSLNAYRGCEHGCIYCFARPTHAYLDLSPGLDFETKLLVKPRAAELLRAALAKPGYRCSALAMGTNTDPYQPIEREWRITRQVLELMAECRHPVSIVTKGVLVERDIDLLADLARDGLAQVMLSVTTLDRELARRMEPRAAAPQRRIESIRRLNAAGIPTGVLVAPIVPVLTDPEMEAVLAAAAAAGAHEAGYVLLRLPLEVRDLFIRWLDTHYPLKAAHVMNRVRELRGGRDYEADFGVRQSGRGPYAQFLADRFRLACRRHGLGTARGFSADCSRFRPPRLDGQFDLF